MRQKLFQVLIVIIFLVAACTPTATMTPVTAVPATRTPSPTPTNTSLPSETPSPSTTPLPTISTFTSTFDVSTIVTVTAEAKAKCPTSNPYPEQDFDLFKFREKGNYQTPEEAVLALLNKYGPNILVNYERNLGTSPETIAFQDFTNDGVPELALRLTLDISSTPFDIFGCRYGKYVLLLSVPSNGLGYAPIIFANEDNNRNGIPELTLLSGYASQGGHSFEVYEWDGEKFANLLAAFYSKDSDSNILWVEATGKIYYQNVDDDFLNELILDSGIPVWETYYSGLPWRNKRTYYKWNGQIYVPDRIEFASPEFRFQAVQDGDVAFSQREYEKALSLYQQAIFDDKLKGYSPEIRDNLRAQWNASFGTTPTPTAYPSVLDEYPKLAAYAYYRIILLHLAQGHESDAGTVYKTLRQKFSSDQYGRPYYEMATAFWDAYQSTHKMYDGCAIAIQYATEYPEILIPLGSDYHGYQSHTYIPADVCPF